MVTTENKNSVGYFTDYARAIIDYKEGGDGADLHVLLKKIVYEALIREGYDIKKIQSKETVEDLISGLLVFAMLKVHEKIDAPVEKDIDSLRVFNKNVFNYLMISLRFKIKQDYRQSYRRKRIIQTSSKSIHLMSQDSISGAEVEIENTLNIPFEGLSDFDITVANLLAQQNNKTEIARMLNVPVKKIYTAIERLKNNISSNNIE